MAGRGDVGRMVIKTNHRLDSESRSFDLTFLFYRKQNRLGINSKEFHCIKITKMLYKTNG